MRNKHVLSKWIPQVKALHDLLFSPLLPYHSFNTPDTSSLRAFAIAFPSIYRASSSGHLCDAFPHLLQVLHQCPLLGKPLPDDHLIHNHSSSPNPSPLVLLILYHTGHNPTSNTFYFSVVCLHPAKMSTSQGQGFLSF